jgi:uncharacterized protein DUF6580
MLAFLFVILAIAVRFIPHPWTLTPVGAALLYFGARGTRKLAWIPVVLLAASDLALNKFVWGYPFKADQVIIWLWYAGILWLGFQLRRKVDPLRLLAAALATAVSFFVVSNLGVWAAWNMYPKTLAGLMTCYAAALPFFRRELIGDVMFTAIFFGIAYLVENWTSDTTKAGDRSAAA